MNQSAQSNAGHRILVVDDEANIRDLISMSLKFLGFEVRTAASGDEALVEVAAFNPHVMILDVMMPGKDGYEVCKQVRNEGHSLGIIFLTAKGETKAKIKGLTAGGDDYIQKPFSLEEVVARVQALLRRIGHSEQSFDDEKISYADLELDEAKREVHRAGTYIDLSKREFDLLRYLLINADRVVSKVQILENVWDYDFIGDPGIVETYVSYLRKKIDIFEPPLIHTVRGVGYRLRIAPSK